MYSNIQFRVSVGAGVSFWIDVRRTQSKALQSGKVEWLYGSVVHVSILFHEQGKKYTTNTKVIVRIWLDAMIYIVDWYGT